MSGMSFRNAHLHRATIWDSDMSHCDLSYATFTAATLKNVDLAGSKFEGAILIRTMFNRVRMTGCRGAPSTYERASVSEVDVSDARTTLVLQSGMVDELVAYLRRDGT